MEKHEAEEFRKVWKKPPRTLELSSPSRSNNRSVNHLVTMRFRDLEKGLERLGKTLANKYNVEWREYWPFLDSFADLSSDEGLELLEKYLEYRTNIEFSDSMICADSPEDVSSDGKMSSHNLSDLCRAFQAFNLSDNSHKEEEEEEEEDGTDLPLQVFLCVEKACQVFANRIAQPVLNLLESEGGGNNNNTTQILKSEVKHLKQLITSYMDDARFGNVNFNVVHSRLGTLISGRLRDLVHAEDDYVSLRRKIDALLEQATKHLDYFSSDDESMNHRGQVLVKKKSTTTNKQIMCLLGHILDGFCCTDSPLTDLNTETECVAAWKGAKLCDCVWQIRGTKKSSYSRNNSLRHSSRKLKNHSATPRKLIFDDEDSFKLNNPLQLVSDSSNKEASSSDDEEFFTPPASPSFLLTSQADEEDDEHFDDSQLPEKEVFIEGYEGFLVVHLPQYIFLAAMSQRKWTGPFMTLCNLATVT